MGLSRASPKATFFFAGETVASKASSAGRFPFRFGVDDVDFAGEKVNVGGATFAPVVARLGVRVGLSFLLVGVPRTGGDIKEFRGTKLSP